VGVGRSSRLISGGRGVLFLSSTERFIDFGVESRLADSMDAHEVWLFNLNINGVFVAILEVHSADKMVVFLKNVAPPVELL